MAVSGDFALGLLPHDKAADQLVEVTWRSTVPPPYRVVVDNMTGVTPGLDGNDRWGDCGPTSADNHLRITSTAYGSLVVPDLAEVLALYSASSSPPFDPGTGANDNGVQMPDLLSAMRKVGLAGHRIVAFGRLRSTTGPSIRAAIDTFGAVLFAVDLQEAQDEQMRSPHPVWDYEPTSEWGGHAIVAGAYDDQGVDVFTWATRVRCTNAFLLHQLAEVWVPLWPEVVASNRFARNVETQYVAQQFTTLTGEQWPVPIPTPPPVPVSADAELWQHVRAWALSTHHTSTTSPVVSALRTWAKAKGLT